MGSEEAKIQRESCCFCGKSIVETEIDPCKLTVETSQVKLQIWFCHAECFKKRLQDDPMLVPVYF